MPRRRLLLPLAALFSLAALSAGAQDVLTPEEADRRLGVAFRMIEGGVHDRAAEIASAILESPEARVGEDESGEAARWLIRREAARFVLDRSRFGLAASRNEFLDAAASLTQLADNRYRLPDPAYAVQAAYWAARANEEVGEYREAARLYSRVGGVSIPSGMEGDAALRTSRCLRLLAQELPYPGGADDRRRRNDLLNHAIGELERARLAFPAGDRRRELELELVALRLSRRETQFVRDAASEAEAFVKGDPARDRLRARAMLYRGQAASMLGNPAEAAGWFQRVVTEENPESGDRRLAEIGLALALLEQSELADRNERPAYLSKAVAAMDRALADADGGVRQAGPRVLKARMLLMLNRPGDAMETLEPVLRDGYVNHAVWREAGAAELARGRLEDALRHLYPATRPSNPDSRLVQAASRDAGEAAGARRNFGLALAMNHRASRLLRRERRFAALFASEIQAMDIILSLGRMSGPASLSGDGDPLSDGVGDDSPQFQERRDDSLRRFAGALGGVLSGGGTPDGGYDLAVAAEAADGWTGDGIEKLELAIAMIGHFRQRRTSEASNNLLASRQGEARYALAVAKAGRLLSGDEPSLEGVADALADFAAAAASFREAAAGGLSVKDSLDQGMVGLESGGFLMRLAERWNRGRWSSESLIWRDEARRRIEASLIPFNQANASSPSSSRASRRAKWLRGRAMELMGDWRGAGIDYLSLMNNSELPRALRMHAARRWAVCMDELGDERQALARLAVFADSDAEAALLAGKLAEASGDLREAYRRYMFAADPSSPSLPPASPDRAQEAAYRAARLLIHRPAEADPLTSPEALVVNARAMMENYVAIAPHGLWAVPMLELLCSNWMDSGADGWRTAFRLASAAMERPDAPAALLRSMRIVAAKALAAGGRYPQALDELDQARELLNQEAAARDAARITLEMARIYRRQGRLDDSVRAYAEVFASHPDLDEADEARREAAETVMRDSVSPGDREREQARGILSGLGDQLLAERLMREYGIH